MDMGWNKVATAQPLDAESFLCSGLHSGSCKVILKYYKISVEFNSFWCYNTLMMKRKARQDRKHAVYMLANTNTGEYYIGITVCAQQIKKALKVRMQKHVRRALTENKDWALCRSIREHGADAFELELIEVVRGRKPAHAVERQLIAELCPALNQY